jgi:hypothetical protein
MLVYQMVTNNNHQTTTHILRSAEALIALIHGGFAGHFCEGLELTEGVGPFAVHKVQLGHRLMTKSPWMIWTHRLP